MSADGGDRPETLYREAILEHARNPRNAKPLAEPHRRARASNPLCGDELELTLALEGDAIRAIGVQVRGCAIAQASASLMSDAIKGRALADAITLGERFRALMGGDSETLPEALGTLEPLQAVRAHRSRIPCTLLAWNALRTAAADDGTAKGEEQATRAQVGAEAADISD